MMSNSPMMVVPALAPVAQLVRAIPPRPVVRVPLLLM
jgi:hypothetical protein